MPIPMAVYATPMPCMVSKEVVVIRIEVVTLHRGYPRGI